jgi:hypothetical protein
MRRRYVAAGHAAVKILCLEAVRDQQGRKRQRAGDHPDREEPNHHGANQVPPRAFGE